MTKKIELNLLKSNSVQEFITKFFELSLEEQLSVFCEEVKVLEGTTFYRVRRVNPEMDPNDPKEWGPVPKELAKQGRFNLEGESVLYVATYTSGLEREIGIKEGEEFYLAKYICKKEFSVASFLGLNSDVNSYLHKIAMSIADGKVLNGEERIALEKHYSYVKNRNFVRLMDDMLSSLFIHKMVPNLYDTTNKLWNLIKVKNEYGLRYAPAYKPIESSGGFQILTFNGEEDGNYALTEKGYNNIEFVEAKKFKSEDVKGLEIMIEVFSDEQTKMEKMGFI